MNAAAKLSLLIAALIATAACGSVKRFAPPGIIRYEQIAGDQPMNPQIQERAAVRQKEHDAKFPNLSEQPQAAPEGLPEAEVEGYLLSIRQLREGLDEAVAADLALAIEERAHAVEIQGFPELRSLQEAREALAKAIQSDDAAARAERGLPPRQQQE